MLPFILKRVTQIKYFFPLVALAFIVSKVAHYLGNKDTPRFLIEMEEKLPTNPHIVAKLGNNIGFKATYNENDLGKDTLKYAFSLQGSKGTMHIQGYTLKQEGKWVPTKSDTVFAQ
jgi:hypothetical protein